MKEELIDYVKALTNLYGVVSKEKLIEIYNMQNDEQITQKEVDEILTKEVTEEFHRIIDGDLYVHDYLYMYPHQLPELLAQQEGKHYYIPEKNELMKYVDEVYFEKTKEYRDLENFLHKELEDKRTAEIMLENLYGWCEDGDAGDAGDAGLDSIMFEAHEAEIEFESQEELEKIMRLTNNLTNNIRLKENRGHTPQEMMEIARERRSDKPKKIGRNDSCPCGSGRKYKRCCIDK